jgi:ABC-2 type transport system ATP-binding protein
VEVEQLCDHVVILNQGRKIFDGRWADLAADRRQVRFAVDDWDRAKALLSEAAGVRIDGVGMISLDEHCEIADLVARLVHGDVRVSAVEPLRRNLEQIYLSLTHPVASGKES